MSETHPKTVVIIPCRYGSSRFAGKPLHPICGVSMIERVYGRAMQARGIEKVVVATDDPRIAEAVSAFGGKVMMTSIEAKSGTDRVAEAAERLGGHRGQRPGRSASFEPEKRRGGGKTGESRSRRRDGNPGLSNRR